MTTKTLHPAVAAYRIANPSSRAVDHTTWAGSTGCVRRATCIYCRCVVATSSASYRETKRSIQARAAHGEACAAQYLSMLSTRAA